VANAADTAATATPAQEKVELGPPPKDFTLKNDYYKDCQQVVDHMRYAVQLEKGNPVLAEVATKTKEEMNEFVSFYRRFDGINGRQSFSLLYTSINVLAGHYTSYGVKFPVPEKRRKRLLQEFNDIEKNIRKKR
jgi:photosystem II Psb27 protein